jgi:hypothetical protein
LRLRSTFNWLIMGTGIVKTATSKTKSRTAMVRLYAAKLMALFCPSTSDVLGAQNAATGQFENTCAYGTVNSATRHISK